MPFPETVFLFADLLILFLTGLLITGIRKGECLSDWSLSVGISAALAAVVPLMLTSFLTIGSFPLFIKLSLYGELAILLILRRHQLQSIYRDAMDRLRSAYLSLYSGNRTDKWLLALTLILLAVCGITALLSHPAIYDSLTYRLPRLGHWLQNGGIHHFPAIDERQNWMPVVPDLLMLWIVAHQKGGFAGVQLVQFFGGMLCLLGIYQFARLSGLSRQTTRVAGLLFISMPNVFVQLMSSHTDLITAGFTMAGLCFLVKSLQEKRFYWQAGATWALAFGSKGILFYWVLGLPLLLALLVLHYKTPLSVLLKHAVCFTLFASVLVLPKHLENHRFYGNPFANPELVERHHPDLTFSQSFEKTYLNGLSYAVQLFDPQSNPAVIVPLTSPAGALLTRLLPENDPYLFDVENRQKAWKSMFTRNTPDADGLSTGIIVSSQVIIGAIILLLKRKKRKDSATDPLLAFLVYSLGLFFLFFCYKHNAHLYAYRYFVVFAAPMALIAASLLERIPDPRRTLWCWVLIALPVIHIPYLWSSTSQVGLNNVFSTDKNRNLVLYNGTRSLLNTSPGDRLKEIFLGLPYNYPIAGFFGSGKSIYNESDLANLATDSQPRGLIIPIGEIGRVDWKCSGRSFLFKDGDINFSCVLLTLGEELSSANPFIYDLDREITPGGIRESISLYRNGKRSLELMVNNPSGKAHWVAWKNGDVQGGFALEAASRETVTIPITKSDRLELYVSSYYEDQDYRGFPEDTVSWKLSQVNYPVNLPAD